MTAVRPSRRLGPAFAAGFAFGLALSPRPAVAGPLVVKLGSLAPEGSPWHTMLLKLREDWARLSGGSVELRVYPSGLLGEEEDMLRKMRIGQIQAVGLTSDGLARIDPAVMTLEIPLAFATTREFDEVRAKIEPELEARYAARGARILCWTDVGWIQFFSRKPVATIDELRRLKFFVSAGDDRYVQLYTRAGFNAVTMGVTGVVVGLKTGLIEAIDAPPLVALLGQWFTSAPYLLDLKWTPLVGAIVVDERTWAAIPPSLRPALKDAAVKAAADVQRQGRRMGDDAIVAMAQRGLVIRHLSPEELAGWRTAVDGFLPTLRTQIGDPALFDRVIGLRDSARTRERGGWTAAATEGRSKP